MNSGVHSENNDGSAELSASLSGLAINSNVSAGSGGNASISGIGQYPKTAIINVTKDHFTANPTTSVLVADLSYFCSEEDLIALFSRVGRVVAACVCRGKNRNPMHYGFVQLASPELVDIAIERLHNIVFIGRFIR